MRVCWRVRALEKPYDSCHYGLLASDRGRCRDHGWRRGEWEPRRSLDQERRDDARNSDRDEVIRTTHLRVIAIAMHGGVDINKAMYAWSSMLRSRVLIVIVLMNYSRFHDGIQICCFVNGKVTTGGQKFQHHVGRATSLEGKGASCCQKEKSLFAI
jgi:hypothetical protein